MNEAVLERALGKVVFELHCLNPGTDERLELEARREKLLELLAARLRKPTKGPTPSSAAHPPA